MYSIRLVTVGKKDYVHQNAFEAFKRKCYYELKFCPDCRSELIITFFEYHDDNDELMVRMDIMCNSCNYSNSRVGSYYEVSRTNSI